MVPGSCTLIPRAILGSTGQGNEREMPGGMHLTASFKKDAHHSIHRGYVYTAAVSLPTWVDRLVLEELGLAH